MSILYIAIGVCAVVFVAWVILTLIDGRRLRGMRMPSRGAKVAQGPYKAEAPGSSPGGTMDDTKTPSDLKPKPKVDAWKMYKAGMITYGEAINITRAEAGYEPMKFEHGEDMRFYLPPLSIDDDDTKTWPIMPGNEP